MRSAGATSCEGSRIRTPGRMRRGRPASRTPSHGGSECVGAVGLTDVAAATLVGVATCAYLGLLWPHCQIALDEGTTHPALMSGNVIPRGRHATTVLRGTLRALGFTMLEGVGSEQAIDRYFRNRTDGLRPGTGAHVVGAIVGGGRIGCRRRSSTASVLRRSERLEDERGRLTMSQGIRMVVAKHCVARVARAYTADPRSEDQRYMHAR